MALKDFRHALDSPQPGMKICGKCQKEFPRNADWFDRDKDKVDGFKRWCKQCRKERREVKELEQSHALVKTLDAAVVANLSEARPGGSVTPHQLEFYQCLTTLFGGVQGAAMHWMATFIAAQPGSQTRERLLGQYNKLMIACSDSNKISPPPELMSDEELNTAISRDEERIRRNEEKMRQDSIPGTVVIGDDE